MNKLACERSPLQMSSLARPLHLALLRPQKRGILETLDLAAFGKSYFSAEPSQQHRLLFAKALEKLQPRVLVVLETEGSSSLLQTPFQELFPEAVFAEARALLLSRAKPLGVEESAGEERPCCCLCSLGASPPCAACDLHVRGFPSPRQAKPSPAACLRREEQGRLCRLSVCEDPSFPAGRGSARQSRESPVLVPRTAAACPALRRLFAFPSPPQI